MRYVFGLLAALSFATAAHAIDWSSRLPFEKRSHYFEFHYQRQTWDCAAFARFADAFVQLVDRDFLRTRFDYPIQVLVLPDRENFQRFLRREFAVSDPSNFGMYFPAFKVFVTYEDSGLGTFAHEIMHPLVDRNLPDCPPWAAEAIPAFFEKFVGYWEGDRIVLEWGYQNPWRIDAIGDRLLGLDLRRILSDGRAVSSFDNSERRLLTVFLWQLGRLQRFFQLVQTRQRAGFASYFEAAMERPLAKIIPLWQRYLAEIDAHRADIMRVPPSIILPDRASYEGTRDALALWLSTPDTRPISVH